MKLTDVIRRPLVTEKTTLIREDNRTLVFEVATGATKVDIKRAVEKLLGSKVEGVRTAISHGKMKRQGRFVGRRSDWKKAYVKLRDGEKIPEFLEGPRSAVASCSCRLTVAALSTGRLRLQGSAICLFENTTRRRRAGGSRRCRCSTRSPRPSRTSRWSSRCGSRAAGTITAS